METIQLLMFKKPKENTAVSFSTQVIIVGISGKVMRTLENYFHDYISAN